MMTSTNVIDGMTSTIYKIITKEFLESVLNCKIASYRIEGGSKAGDNFMSVLYSILVEINEGSDLPLYRHFLIKCFPDDLSQQVVLKKCNHFYTELCFYTTLAKDLARFPMIRNPGSEVSLAFPPFYAGKAVNFEDALGDQIYGPLDNFILMSDLRNELGYKMGPREMDYEHVKLAFVELAKMHAVSWAFKNSFEGKDEDFSGKYPFLERMQNPRKIEMWLGFLKENGIKAVEAVDKVKGKGNLWSESVNKFCEKGRAVLEYNSCAGADEEREMLKLLKISNETGSELDVHWRVVCHGDIWSNNMLFKYDPETGSPINVCLVDFPLVKLACPTVDLACLVFTSTRRSFRKNCLENCLQIYHDTFLEICEQMKVDRLPGFSIRSLKSKFRGSALVGLAIAVISLPSDLKHVEKEEETGERMQKQRDTSLYEEWIVELIEDVCEEGII